MNPWVTLLLLVSAVALVVWLARLLMRLDLDRSIEQGRKKFFPAPLDKPKSQNPGPPAEEKPAPKKY